MSGTSRRAFVQGVVLSGATVGVACVLGAAPANALSRSASGIVQRSSAGAANVPATSQTQDAIVSFHLDQPYLDFSGQALPYCPPTGARAAQPVAELSEAAFHCCFLGA